MIIRPSRRRGKPRDVKWKPPRTRSKKSPLIRLSSTDCARQPAVPDEPAHRLNRSWPPQSGAVVGLWLRQAGLSSQQAPRARRWSASLSASAAIVSVGLA
jgi:hypothetical protein